MKTAFLFPGQGAQSVGMGADVAKRYPQAAALYEKADEIVGFALSKLCFEGPADKLNSTAISQPAIFVSSAAILEVLRGNNFVALSDMSVAAGLSLGEYTALYASGLISFEEGLKLVSRRGEAMQEASDASGGGMVCVIGLDEDKVDKLAEEAAEGDLLVGVNYNCPGQIVLSGTESACERAEKLAPGYGAIKAVRLDVAGAFHTEMMTLAAEKLGEALSESEIFAPGEIKTIANIDSHYYNSAEDIASGLIKQLTSPILWQKCMERLLADGIENFYEIGPGRVLTGLMRRIHRKTKVINISTVDGLEKVL